MQCTPKVGDAAKSTAKDKAKDLATTAQNFRSGAPAPGPAPKIEIGSYESFKLENGLNVIVVENHKLPRVSWQLSVDVPPIQEKEFAGYVSIAGQLLNKGTKNRSKAEIDEAIDFIGATLNPGGAGIFGASLTKHKDVLLGIMSDVLLNPTFPEDEFEKIKKQTLSGLASDKEDPNAIARNVSRILRYGKDHPYGEIETEESIDKITLDKCKSYYNTYYKPNISYLVVVGDITKKEASVLAKKYFGSWKASNNIPKKSFAKPTKPKGTMVDFVNKTGAVQSVINVTYPVELQPGSADVIKARVMNTLLGGFFRSRLNANLREDKAYTYGSRSSLSSDKEVGFFNAGASVRNEVTDSSVIQFMYELNKIRTEKISNEELTLVKNVMSGNFARSLERPQTIARFALNTYLNKLPSDYYATYLRKLSAVSADDVLAMAKKYITPQNAHIVVVGNKSEVADKIAQFATSGKVNFYDRSGNPIEDKGMTIPDGVTAETVLQDYVTAIGGMKAISGIKDMTTVMTADIGGNPLEIAVQQKLPNKFTNTVSMQGMVMEKSVFNGTAGMVTSRGQSVPMPPEKVAESKVSNVIIAESKFKELGVKTKLIGIEMINNKKAYAMEIELPSGKKSTSYFDLESSLKVREVSTESQGERSMTISVDLSNYTEVNGVKFPHKQSVSGMMPVPLIMEVKELKVNSNIEDSAFESK